MIAPASGAARNATANATSSGSSSRPSGAIDASASSPAPRPVRASMATIRSTDAVVMSVRTYAGQTALAVTPVPATSAATARMSPTTACLEAV